MNTGSHMLSSSGGIGAMILAGLGGGASNVAAPLPTQTPGLNVSMRGNGTVAFGGEATAAARSSGRLVSWTLCAVLCIMGV